MIVDVAAGAIGGFAASTQPAVWISGVSGALRFENLGFESAWNATRLGIDSNGNRTTTGAQGITFRNVSGATSNVSASAGPTVDAGANVFWIWFEGCTMAANAAAAVGTDAHANMVINRGSGGGSFLITVKDNVWNGGGGIKYYTAGAGGSLFVDNLTIEGNAGHGDPAVWLPSAGVNAANLTVDVNNVALADYTDVVPVVQVDGQLSPAQIRVSNSIGSGLAVKGPATIIGSGDVQNLNTQALGPAFYNQTGFFSSSYNAARVYGQQDTLRRSFAPVSTRFVNLSPQLPSAWTNGSGTPTITTGISGPDGTTNAGRVSAVGTSNVRFYNTSRTTTVGDWIIAGIWARSNTANGFAGGPSPATVSVSSMTSELISGVSTTAGAINLPQFIQGDGEWGWYYVVFQILTVSGGTGTVQFAGSADSTHTIDFYAPILLHIPNGTVSQNEASEIAMHLVSYPETSVAADVSMLRGHTLHFNGSNFLVDNGSNGTFANGAELRFLSSNGTNYAGFKGGASTTNLVWLFPTTDSTGTQCLASNGSLQFSFTACSGGTGTPGGANTQVQYNNSGSFGGSTNLTWISPALSIGTTAGATGQLKYVGTTSGTVTTQSQDAAGTWTFKWPATAGTAGFPMVTDGTGVGSWSLLGLAGGGTNSGAAAFTNNQLVGVSAGALASLTGTLTGTNPVLTLTSALTTSVPFALNTPASPTADIFDININAVKTSWVDNLGIWHAPSYTATGTGALALTGTEGTCPTGAAGIDVLCIGNSATHTIQSNLNAAGYKDIAQFSNSGPAAHGVCLVGAIFPQLNCTTAGTSGQTFISGGAGADGSFGTLGAVGGGTGNVTNTLHGVGMGEGTAALNFSAAGTAGQAFISGGAGADGAYGTFDLSLGTNTVNNLPINRGGTGAATLAAASIATVTGAITPNDCVKWSSATVITDSGGTCGGAGGSARLDQLLGGTASNTINSTIFPQTWNWALTGSTTAFKFGENTAATGSSNILLQASTLNTSTAVPFQTDSNGNGYQLNSSGLFKPIGTGALATPGAANNLVVSRGSSAAVSYIPPVAAGKVLIDNGPGVDPSFQDPIVSQAYVNLWTTQDVTTTRTSAAVRNPIFSQTGTLQLTWASITGSPATCTLQIQGVDSVGNALNNGSTFAVSPANGTTSQTFTAAAALQNAAQIKAIFACVTYPATGTLTLDYTPIPNVNVTNTVTVAGTVTTTPPSNASTNVTQINGVTPLMGNGVTGTGSQRVTIASDNTAFPVNSTLSAETTKVIGTVRHVGNAGANIDGATGAAPPANVLFVGGLKSGATGGFLTGITVCDSDFAVNISTATTTLAVTGVSGRQVRICSLMLVAAGADNVNFIEGTGATCGTGTAGMTGGTTAGTGPNLAANGGWTQGSGMGEIMTTATTGDSVCIQTSAAVQLSGHIKYTIY
jgi:hypothetical protein